MRHWQRFPVLILAALMLWGCASVEKLSQSGNSAFDKGDNQTAIGFYQKALDQAPHDTWLWNQLGRAYHNLRNYNEAVKAYTKAVEIKPDDAVVWTNLGNLHYQEKRYAEAASAYTKALKIEPTAARWIDLGNSRISQGSHAEAVTAYTKALAINPADELALHWRGWAHFRMGQYNKAIVDFDRVVRSKEYGERALRGRGWSYYRKDLYAEARQDFTAALRIDPVQADGFRGRGWSQYRTGNFQEAIKDFTAALETTNPGEKNWIQEALHGKALAYLGVGDPETAVHLINEAQAAAPLDTWSLIVFYYLSGDRQKAWQLRGGEGVIGVTIQDHQKGQGLGARVVGIQKGSSAAEASFLEGDVIVAVNGTRVSGVEDGVRALAALPPGTIAEIIILRENREKKMPVRIGSAEMMVRSDPNAVPLVRQEETVSTGGEIPAAGGAPAEGLGQGGSGGAAADELF